MTELTVERVSRNHRQRVIEVAATLSGQSLFDFAEGRLMEPATAGLVTMSEIVLPHGIDAPWAQMRESLWNAAERAERRRDANLASLWRGWAPPAADEDAERALALGLARTMADYLLAAVDVSVLRQCGRCEVRALCSAREVGPEGFGAKTRFGLSRPRREQRGLPASPQSELHFLREAWARLCAGDLRQARIAGAPQAVSL
ncbi:MobA/MobL family protein [Xanthobacter sp. V13C-7B]|uniref:MobA/MobL family protein n=1 Tax=Xanthobacter variabilis TaxID=3119932 RepID=UPI0037282767